MSALRPIFEVWPALEGTLPWLELGALPTPIEPLDAVLDAAGISSSPGRAWIKRDDLSSPVYGGNKVRTLEVLFADALARGATHIISTGAFGSNHATAAALHAARVGLEPEALLFPQPMSACARENLEVMLSIAGTVSPMPHWSFLPLAIQLARRRDRLRGHRPVIMVPGGATPLGALGYVSAALELAMQVERGEAVAPKAVVVGVGSTCTSAGLLLGFHLASKLGIGFRTAPTLISIRVTPWPVTAAYRIVSLARDASLLLARLAGEPRLEVRYGELAANLLVDGRFLGPGYGEETLSGRRAIEAFAAHPIALDTTYSAKSGAGLLAQVKARGQERVLYWATKSTVELPPVDLEKLQGAPGHVRRWLAKG